MFKSSENMIFNGIDLADEFSGIEYGDAYFIVNHVEGRGIVSAEQEAGTVESRDGSYPASTRLTNRILEVTFTLKGTSPEDLRKQVERLNKILYTRNDAVEIQFSDELDRVYYGTYSGREFGMETDRIHQSTLLITCHDPYKYSKEEHNVPIVSGRTVENVGNEITYPTIELVAKRPSTFAMINNENDEYLLLGTPTDVDEVIVKERELIMSEYGDTTSKWTSENLGVDKRVNAGGNSRVAGSFNYDGTGIVPASYGTGSNWHGPAITRSIPATQDFEVEAMVRAQTTKPGQTYRIEVYLMDEERNVLGKMAILNSSQRAVNFKAEARYGDFVGARVNYPIWATNYQKSAQHFHGMLRFKRIGNQFEFYVARMGASSGGKHYDTIRRTYNDAKGEYAGKLRYVQIHIGKYGSSQNANLPRINSVRVYRHNRITVDQTPYIVDTGDIIEFENDKEAIYINGENAMSVKNFGAEFFGLHEGFNQLTVTPEDAFEARLRYREKYL